VEVSTLIVVLVPFEHLRIIESVHVFFIGLLKFGKICVVVEQWGCGRRVSRETALRQGALTLGLRKQKTPTQCSQSRATRTAQSDASGSMTLAK
jgi:hypothetical protein